MVPYFIAVVELVVELLMAISFMCLMKIVSFLSRLEVLIEEFKIHGLLGNTCFDWLFQI